MMKSVTVALLMSLPVMAGSAVDVEAEPLPAAGQETLQPAAEPAPAAAAEEDPAPEPPAPAAAAEEPAPGLSAPAAAEEDPAPGPVAAPPHSDDAYRGIVKIEVAVRKNDYHTPWQAGVFANSTGTGFLVAPGVFMTNAHVVANASSLYVCPYDGARKYEAHVLHVAHDADLALVQVDEPEAFADVKPLEISTSLPGLEQPVRAIGYPIGGNRLSVTRGVVSRIDSTVYAHTQNGDHLTVQVDAAINPGNSGGPVLMGDEDVVVGVVFQGLMEANSTGYMIPPTVIARFLKDVEDGRYDGYVTLGAKFLPMFNPGLRAHHNMADTDPGVLVASVAKGSSCDGVLQVGDILLSINGLTVDTAGMIVLDGFRVKLEELAERAFKGDTVTFEILRDGERKTVSATLAPLPANSIMGFEYNAPPRYVEFAGLVFQPLQLDVIQAHQLINTDFMVEMRDFLMEGGWRDKSDIVVVTLVLPDEVNARYTNFGRRIVTKVNGEEVTGLKDLYEKLYMVDKESRPPFTVIEFADAPRPFVVDNATIDAANARIFAKFNIPLPARLK